MNGRGRIGMGALVALSAVWTASLVRGAPGGSPTLAPVVEAEEEVYRYESADNGAGPLWCSGSTCLVRCGEHVFASGLETLKHVKPLNNCRWTLYERDATGWHLRQADAIGRTREPCPLITLGNGQVYLSANPTLTPSNTYAGPARPEILRISAAESTVIAERLLPVWDANPHFSEHSYRSFAADGPNRELILFQNIDYTHAEWAFRDGTGEWAAQGKLRWPQGIDYPKPEPIRVCYPDVALKHRAVYFCGVSDIVEPYPEWRAAKKELTGKEWDYDFRRLFFTWTPDITRRPFAGWIEIASRDKTCGWISPGDLWVGPDGAAHLVWTERAIDERLRDKFFPDARQSHSLNYAVVRDGRVVLHRTLLSTEEGKPGLIASAPRFQSAPQGRLILSYYVQGTDSAGRSVSENRVLEILANGQVGDSVRISFKQPFTAYFTATVRAGSPASEMLELFGQRAGEPLTMSYGRVRLW